MSVPYEFQILTPPCLQNPIASIPPCRRISNTKTPLPLALGISKSCLWYGMDIFWIIH